METPWVILGRVLRVAPGPNDAEAAVDEQAGAPEHVAAEEAAGAQAEHIAAVEEEAELVAEAAAEPDITVLIALPSRVTILAAGRNAHPDPKNPDAYPYIIGTGPVCLLAHFATAPFYGAIFGAYDQYSHLVLVRHFQTAEGQTTASAERIPSRPGGAPVLQNISNVVLASNSRGDYFIGELIFDEGVERAKLVYINSARNAWRGRNVRYPLAAANRRWIPHGAAFVDRTLWWFDLSWGLLSFDAVSQDAHLLFHRLPCDRTLDAATPGIDTRRCITASRNKVRYVEIVVLEGEAAKVAMWSLNRPVLAGWQWELKYTMSFEEIWNDDSYRETELPRNVPVLTAVCPSDPELVYFALEQRLFGVNVPQHRVVHVEDYELVKVLGKPKMASGNWVFAWKLPPPVVVQQDLDH